jgi:hypothetical protein
MSALFSSRCDVVNRTVAAEESEVIRRIRQVTALTRDMLAQLLNDGFALRREQHAMAVIPDIVAVELSEQSLTANPLWMIAFSDIQQLTARQ